MDTTTLCQACEKPSRKALYLCDDCYPLMVEHLAGTPDLMRSLTTTISKQAKVSSSGGKAKNEAQPLPINSNAADRKHQLLSVLINLGLRLHAITDEALPGRKADGLAPWIGNHMVTLRKHPEAGHWHNELTKAYRNALHAIDRPAERISVGKCGAPTDDGGTCPKELLARSSQRIIRCPACGADWDVRGRQRNAISAAWDAISYPPVIVRALQQWDTGLRISIKDIKNWVQLNHLEYAAMDANGRKMYRVSDVQKVALAMAARRR